MAGRVPTTDVTFAPPPPVTEARRPQTPARSKACCRRVFVLALAVLMGEKLNDYAREAGFLLPGFLSAMIAGVVITNLADVFKYPA